MKKGYWITMFTKINDPAKLEAYRNIAGPVITGAGGKFLARGLPVKAYEHGQIERAVLVEFDSVEKAIQAYESAEYQEALRALGDGAERDLRIVEGAG